MKDRTALQAEIDEIKALGPLGTKARLRLAALELALASVDPPDLRIPQRLSKRCPGPTHATEEERVLPPRAFYVKLERRDGLSVWCRACHRDYARKHPPKYVPGKARPGGVAPRGLTALQVARRLARAAMDPDRVPRQRTPIPPGYRRCKNPECRRDYIPPGSRGVAIPRGKTVTGKQTAGSRYRIDYCDVCRHLPQYMRKSTRKRAS